MRASFVKSPQKSKSQKCDNKAVQSLKYTKQKRNFFEDKLNGSFYNKKQDGSLSVSFNLDQMYFESDTSAQQSVKEKPGNSKKEQFTEVVVNAFRQESFQVQKANKSEQNVNPIFDNNLQQSQQKKQAVIKGEMNFQSLSEPDVKEIIEEKYKDQQVQVDFPQIQDENHDSVSQLSEIDMLFIFPQNISKYNQSHPLNVTVNDLAKIYSLDLKLMKFVRLDPQVTQEIDKKICQAFMTDWSKSQERLSKKVLTLAKMRTIIIRDAMNNLVDQLVPPVQSQDYHFRISKTYRSRYIKAGIPIPPPRVNNSYLQGLFSQQQIKDFYQNYVEEKLEIFLKDQNYRKIQIYTLDLIQCRRLNNDKSVQELVQILQKKKKPFTNKQIQLIIEEARKIGSQYGKDIKRIGNGARRSKISQKSLKKLQKINSANAKITQKISIKSFNQTNEQESTSDVVKIEHSPGKKVKLEEQTQEVKVQVKIEQNTPKVKRKNISSQSTKIHKQIKKNCEQQTKVKIE